jgi:hypothetical protein
MTEPIEHILWSDYVPSQEEEEESEYTAEDYADDYGDEPDLDD